MEDKGLRHNTGKTRHDLVPAFAQEQYAKVLTKGSEKYAERNWELGMRWSKVIASLQRHLEAIKKGEDHDQETGLLHSAHVMCNAAFLTEYYKIFPQGDDRTHNYLRRPKIGLDIDEVICDFTEGWNKLFGVAKRPTSWNYDRKMGLRFKNLKDKNKLDKFYLSLKPKIDPLSIPFEPCCYVTSRPVPTKTTEQWLDNHGFPGSKVLTVGVNESKVEALKKAGVEIFVDDRYENFVDLNNAGICCYLFDAPHNRRYNVGHKRIFDLKELV